MLLYQFNKIIAVERVASNRRMTSVPLLVTISMSLLRSFLERLPEMRGWQAAREPSVPITRGVFS